MTKTEDYRRTLRELDHWEDFLLRESNLPGPRANLELLGAVVDEGDEAFFRYCLSFDAEEAPVNSPQVFLAACGVTGLGKLLAQRQRAALDDLRPFASDPRWRIREAVVMALEQWAHADRAAWMEAIRQWCAGNAFEKRAAIAALCHPDLLKNREDAQEALQLLDTLTDFLISNKNPKDEGWKVLRQGLGYCWSVAVAALPEAGKPAMEKWLVSPDKEARRLMIENLKKNRLQRIDPDWTARWSSAG